MSSQLTDSVNDEQERSDAETVDPRVQIELEKLNAATDDINKLEVDLDEARAGFRQLLCESTLRIDALARKLGNCVEKARPYYEARIKAKEALHETQLAAVRFERANSAHAAAKEMVYLAEEGLCTEGRTFDHAWQEMLNHATMRVNESELERTLSEAEHRRTSQSYQIAEIRVHQLQKDLKRSIAKSRPYFELKAQFNQLLEEQKIKVKELEKKVGAAKTSYAEALSNLEQISDEIHRIRKFENEKESKDISNGRATGGVGETGFVSAPTLSAATTLSSSTGHWSDSETTGSPDSESEDQYLQLPDKVGPSASPIIPQRSSSNQKSGGSGEFFSSSFKKILNKNSESVETGLNSNHICNQQYSSDVRTESTNIESEVHAGAADSQFSSTVKSTDEEPVQENVIQSLFSKIVPAKLRQNNSERCSQKMPDRGLPNQNVSSSLNYCTLPSELALCGNDQVDDDSKYETVSSSKDAAETWSELSLTLSNKTSPELEAHSGVKQPNEIWTEVNLNDSSQSTDAGDAPPPPPIPPPLPNSSGDENVNSTPIRMKLDSSSISNWISRSSVDQNNSVNGSRRQSLDTLIMGSLATGERVKEILSQGIMKLNISSLTERRSSEPPIDKPSLTMSQATVVSATKKVPSPLEKSILYLNPEDDSASDSESLASVEMLNDDQISSLMLDNEIQEACQKVLGTPLSDLAASASAHIQR